MSKNIILLLLFIPCLSSFKSIKPIEDFSQLINSSELVVLAKVTDFCQKANSDNMELAELHTVQTLKGRPTSTFFVEFSSAFLNENAKASTKVNAFKLDGEYLLFLQNDSESGYTTINQSQFVVEQVEVGGQLLFRLNDKLFDYQRFLQAIESFIYNEVELIESEFLLSE